MTLFYYPTASAEQIAKTLGKASSSGHGWWDCRCPSHDDRNPSLSVKITGTGRLIFTCHAGCDREDVERELVVRGLLSPLRSFSPTIAIQNGIVDERLSKLEKLLSRNIELISGTPGDRALHRLLGCPLPSYPEGLYYRSHAIKDDDGEWAGAIIALCQNIDGQVSAALVRYVKDDGSDAPMLKRGGVKQTRGIIEGATFRLSGKRPLILCEGLTTGLALWIATGHETWAYGGIKNLLQVPLSEATKGVIVFGDNDDGKGTPQQVAKLEEQYTDAIDAFIREGRWVVFTRPMTAGFDGRDVLLNGGGQEELRCLIYKSNLIFESSGAGLDFDYALYDNLHNRTGGNK